MNETDNTSEIVVAAMYHFVHLPDYVELRPALLACCNANHVKGTILLAEEGVNGTVAGPRAGIDAVLTHLRADARLAALTAKESYTGSPPFARMKVKLKREIVTMGVPGVAPAQMTGVRVQSEAWNALVNDPDVLVLDTRNQYEHDIGTFTNAVSPNTQTFREFPAFVAQQLDPARERKIAMFCTGGIRCEKASNYLLQQGFEQVYHLDGGILKYLEQTQPDDSLWQGECFVFDDRVAVKPDLSPGSYAQCSACRHPVSETERASALFVAGISCPHCHDKVSADKLARLAERKRQAQLRAQRTQTPSDTGST